MIVLLAGDVRRQGQRVHLGAPVSRKVAIYLTVVTVSMETADVYKRKVTWDGGMSDRKRLPPLDWRSGVLSVCQLRSGTRPQPRLYGGDPVPGPLRASLPQAVRRRIEGHQRS